MIKYLASLPFFVPLSLAVMCVITGDWLAKLWSSGNASNSSLIPLAGACYLMSGIFYMPALLHHGSLIVTSTIWSVASVFGFVVVGLLLGETLDLKQIVGLTLGLVSVVLLSL